MPAVWFRGVVDGLTHRARFEGSRIKAAHPVQRDVHVFGNDVTAIRRSPVHERGDDGGADAHVGVEHRVARIRHGENEALYEFDGELAGMNRFFRVIALHVRESPHVARVLALGVPRELADVRSLEVFLARIFRRNPYRVEIPGVIVSPRPPVDRFVSAREPLGAVKAVAETPDDSVAELEALRLKDGIENRVERDDLSVFHIIADLPADGAFRMQQPNALANHTLLRLDVSVERSSRFVFFSEVVRGRGDDELHPLVGKLAHENEVVRAREDGLAFGFFSLQSREHVLHRLPRRAFNTRSGVGHPISPRAAMSDSDRAPSYNPLKRFSSQRAFHIPARPSLAEQIAFRKARGENDNSGHA